MKDGTSTSPRGRGATRPLQNMLAGLARCPDCGAAMTRVSKGRKGGQPKLVCTMAKVGKAKHYASVPLDTVEEAFRTSWQALLADVPAGAPDEHLNRTVLDLQGTISAKEDHLADILQELGRQSSQTAMKAARRIEEELRTLREQLADAETRRELADRGMVAARLEGLRDVIEDEARPMEPARVNAALKVLFTGVTIDHRQGVLRFHWRQGGETLLVYAWVDQPT